VKAEQGINLFPFSELAVLPEWTGMDPSPLGILPSKPMPPQMPPPEDAVEKNQPKLSGENQPASAPQ
jgi:general secretion pathway protein D